MEPHGGAGAQGLETSGSCGEASSQLLLEELSGEVSAGASPEGILPKAAADEQDSQRQAGVNTRALGSDS